MISLQYQSDSTKQGVYHTLIFSLLSGFTLRFLLVFSEYTLVNPKKFRVNPEWAKRRKQTLHVFFEYTMGRNNE